MNSNCVSPCILIFGSDQLIGRSALLHLATRRLMNDHIIIVDTQNTGCMITGSELDKSIGEKLRDLDDKVNVGTIGHVDHRHRQIVASLGSICIVADQVNHIKALHEMLPNDHFDVIRDVVAEDKAQKAASNHAWAERPKNSYLKSGNNYKSR